MADTVNLTDTFYPAEGSAHGYGSQLLVGFDSGSPGSPEIFEAVAEVRTIAFGDMTTGNFKRTHLRSPDAHEEVEAALRSSGPFSLECNWRPRHSSQSYNGGGSGAFVGGGMLRQWVERRTRNFKIVLAQGENDPVELPFTGFVSKFQPGAVNATDGPNLTLEIQPKNGAWHTSLP
jgi:hypothetical protein